MNRLYLIISVFFSLIFATACGDIDAFTNIEKNAVTFNSDLSYGTVTDIDGNDYKTITIGTQTWMAENLKTTRFRNGDTIPNISNAKDWSKLTKSAFCAYRNTLNTDSIHKFGVLYNWYAVKDCRKIAPEGWHIPTDAEWKILQDYLSAAKYNALNGDSTKDIAKSLASSSDWILDSTNGAIGFEISTNNTSGFTAIPSGMRTSNGEFRGLGISCCFFGIGTNPDFSECYCIGLLNNCSGIANYAYGGIERNGYSIRCVKNTN